MDWNASTHLDMLIFPLRFRLSFLAQLVMLFGCFPVAFRKVRKARIASLFCLGFSRLLIFARFRANFFSLASL